MMSIQAEPQAIEDDADAPVADDATLIDDGDLSELAPDEQDSPAEREEKVTFDDRQQAKLDEIIGKTIQERREANERAARLEQELAEARKAIPEPVAPVIPDLPDPFDDDFAAKVAERDQKLREAVAHEERQRVLLEQRQQAEQQAAFDQQQAQNAKAQTYINRVKAAGVSEADLTGAITAVAQAGVVNPEVWGLIMDEDDGALTLHLAKNPLEADNLRKMTTVEAVRYIDKVKPTLSGKRASNAPKPAATLPSGGASSSTRGPKGATYE